MDKKERKIFEQGFRMGEKAGAERAVQIFRRFRAEERKKPNPDLLQASEAAIKEIEHENNYGYTEPY